LSPAGGGRILVMDDVWTSRSFIISLLRENGHVAEPVDTVPAWPHNLALLRDYDIVIISERLPQRTGIRQCQEIRTAFSLIELPVLILSEFDSTSLDDLALAAGANEVLPLAFCPADLLFRVGQLLHLRNSATEFVRSEMDYWHPKLNPHFLYNTLSAIAALNEEDPSAMRKLIESLGEYLRGLFRFAGTMTLSSLDQELQLVKAYLAIEKIRFGPRLQICMKISDDIDHVPIPPFTIQTLVQHAIQHRLFLRQQGGRLELSALAEHGYCIIRIHDNGVPCMDADSHRFGNLSHIERKLRQASGTGLCIQSGLPGGTTITFKIPVTGGQIV